MKEMPSLDDLMLFLAVADNGGLAGAARLTGRSVPTLSRRMQQLERVLEQVLFSRGKQGYILTAQGRVLRENLSEFQGIERDLRKVLEHTPCPQVRITAGSWTALFLAQNLPRFWNQTCAWVPDFMESTVPLDIARRGADIGLRNAPPEQPWLAGRRTRRVTYAVYARSIEVKGFLGLSERVRQTPSAKWVWDTYREDISITATNPRMLLDLACAGAGLVVLPCFVGETVQELQQIGERIEALSHEEWLVCHHEARHDRVIRDALDRLSELLCS